MTVDKIINSTITAIGKDVLQVCSFHKESKLIIKDDWNKYGYKVHFRIYEIPDVYAVIAKHRFIFLDYQFVNNIFCFGRLRINGQKKIFRLICEYFDQNFHAIKEDNCDWQTIDTKVKIRLTDSDDYHDSEIEFYSAELIPDEIKKELNILDAH